MAVGWNAPAGLPPIDLAMQHPDLLRYHSDWGRRGDAGCIAELGRRFVGGAFYRLFAKSDHGTGFVDEATPELGIAVADGHRGQGLGRRLMLQLASIATAEGFERLSLSVDKPNPARHLYSSLDYRTVDDSGDSLLMVLDLVPQEL